MKRKKKPSGMAIDLPYGEFPFFDHEVSADAADAARYRYITRPGRTKELRILAKFCDKSQFLCCMRASCEEESSTKRAAMARQKAASLRGVFANCRSAAGYPVVLFPPPFKPQAPPAFTGSDHSKVTGWHAAQLHVRR